MGQLRKSTLALAVCSAMTGPAVADVPFDQIISFGGSFEDIGQFPDIDFVSVALPDQVAPPGAGLDGSTGFRITNLEPDGQRGRAWVERFSADVGIGEQAPSTPLLFPGARTDIPETNNINFAYGGGRAADMFQAIVGESVVEHPINDSVPADLSATSPGFEQRLASGELTISRRTLFAVNPAGNDVRDTSTTDPVGDGTAAATSTLAIIDRLVGDGAHTIISPTFPPLGQLAESSNVEENGSRTPLGEARNTAATAYNDELARGLPGVGGNIVVVDWNRLFLEMLAQPGVFGFSPQIDHTRYCYSATEWSMTGVNCTEGPGLGKSSGGNPDNFVSNDGLHPTAATAQILADYTAAVLRAPGMVALLPEAALADARAFGHTVSDYQVGRRWGDQPKGFDVFASVQGEDTDFDESDSTPGASSDAVDLTLGLALEINEHWFAGAALGSQNSEVDIDGAGSEFEGDSLMGSLFLGYRSERLFSDISLSYGSSDLDDIKRVITLGTTLVRTEKGDTEADILGAAAVVGFDILVNNSIRFGPFLGLDYLDVEVDGYAEKSSDSTAMQFGDQERDSLLGSVGLFASYPFQVGQTQLEAYGDVAYRMEFEDDTDDVDAVVKNLASGVHFRLPGYDVDDESWVVRAGLGAQFGALRCSLFGSYEDNDRETSYFGLSIAYDL